VLTTHEGGATATCSVIAGITVVLIMPRPSVLLLCLIMLLVARKIGIR